MRCILELLATHILLTFTLQYLLHRKEQSVSGYFSVHCQALAATSGPQSQGCVKSVVVPLTPFSLVLTV